jgi:hypothetical protein
MLVECRLVADDTVLVFDTTADAFEENAWQALLRKPFEIADAERILEAHGIPPVVASNDRNGGKREPSRRSRAEAQGPTI